MFQHRGLRNDGMSVQCMHVYHYSIYARAALLATVDPMDGTQGRLAG